MGRPRKDTTATKKTKVVPELLFEDGYYWIVTGNKRLNVGRNQKYAEKYMAETFNK
jgi:hypothetical protein